LRGHVADCRLWRRWRRFGHPRDCIAGSTLVGDAKSDSHTNPDSDAECDSNADAAPDANSYSDPHSWFDVNNSNAWNGHSVDGACTWN